MSKLEPCPFCGGEPVFSNVQDCTHYWYICCENCDYTNFYFGSKDEVVKIWNTRPAEDALKAVVEELRYIVEQFSKWTAEGGCVKAYHPDFPCWWECNHVELELDDYCDSDDEIKHNCWVGYYRWKYRQKLNSATPEKGKGVEYEKEK